MAERDTALERSNLAIQEESRRRQDAERMANANAGRANEATIREAQSNYDTIVSSLTAAESQAAHLVSEHAKASADADYAKAAQIQLEMAKVGARIERLEDGKRVLDDQRSREPARPAPQQATAPDQIDWNRPWNSAETETVLRGYTPKTAAWIRQHDKFATSTSFRNQVVAAHQMAVAKEIKPDTDDYFRFVEQQVGISEPDPAPATVQPAPAPKAPVAATVTARKSPVPAATPSRTTPNASPGTPGGTPITLTAEERKLARQMFTPDVIGKQDPDVVYAKQKAALIREGKITA